ncbi:MAG: hypothetical protein LBP62_04505 [Clostridiales bacterium]|nr:hypothetical protein [Clostridiales bacterium]
MKHTYVRSPHTLTRGEFYENKARNTDHRLLTAATDHRSLLIIRSPHPCTPPTEGNIRIYNR